MKKKSTEDYKKELKEFYGYEPYEFLEDYKNKQTRIKVKCNKCNNIIDVLPSSINRKIRNDDKKVLCNFCNPAFKDLEYYNNLYYNRIGHNPYKFLEEYKSSRTAVKAICLNCKNKISVIPNKIYENYKLDRNPPCKFCAVINLSKSKIISHEEYILKIKDLSKKNKILGYDILEKYKGDDVNILHKCLNCKYEWKIRPGNLVNSLKNMKPACPSCNNMKRDHRSYEERLFEIHKNRIKNIEPYLKRDIKIKHKCNICNHIWKATPGNILRGNKCPKCSKKYVISSHEDKIFKFIKEDLKIDNIIRNSRKIIGDGKEIDIYLPDYKLAIEINGLYWHSEKFKYKSYHYDKFINCEKLGIKLIQFFDDEIIYNFDYIKSLIKKEIEYINIKNINIIENHISEKLLLLNLNGFNIYFNEIEEGVIYLENNSFNDIILKKAINYFMNNYEGYNKLIIKDNLNFPIRREIIKEFINYSIDIVNKSFYINRNNYKRYNNIKEKSKIYLKVWETGERFYIIE